MQKDAQERRFGQLDALRAFAVLAVVAYHTLDPAIQPWAVYGAMASSSSSSSAAS
jgi:peptidoglycan/LPS O-acetylase OafA/YrhL